MGNYDFDDAKDFTESLYGKPKKVGPGASLSDWDSLIGRTAREVFDYTGDYRELPGLYEAGQVAYPEEFEYVKSKEKNSLYNKVESQKKFYSRQFPDHTPIPDYFQQDRLGRSPITRGFIPDDIDILDNELGSLRKYPPAYFEGSEGKKFYGSLLDEFRNERLAEFATQSPDDPRVQANQSERRKGKKELENFIQSEGLEQTPKTPKKTEANDFMEEKVKAMERKLYPQPQTDLQEISQGADELLEELGPPVERKQPYYQDPKGVVRQRTDYPNSDELLREVERLTPPARTNRTPKVNRALTRAKGVLSGLGGPLADVIGSAGLEILTGEDDIPKALYKGVTEFLPESENTTDVRTGERPITIDGQEYYETSEPSKVYGADGKKYGVQIRGGKREIVPYGGGTAGRQPLKSVGVLKDAIVDTGIRRARALKRRLFGQ